ncbi:MAG: TIGR00282 family metallophosphoesterase [Ruminiclostridium sp.]|nr:TIGR00282 family metallophosphoesterase [Ruminiclostridium sp.]
MNILFVGDVVGQRAAAYLIKQLPKLKRDYSIEMTIVNGENSADGNGITPTSADILLTAADIITTGNHCFRRKEMNERYELSSDIIRPANFGDTVGKGYTVYDMGKTSVAVINLIGMAYMESCDNPFHCADELLKTLDTPNIIVDFHAEATSEKKAMGYYLAGRVSAVIGTHTHVQTADEQILDGHTGYITDVGFTGVRESVLGIDKDVIIKRMTTYYPQRHTYPEGGIMINAVALGIDERCGKCTSIERINISEDD